jgi:hypothetical protein
MPSHAHELCVPEETSMLYIVNDKGPIFHNVMHDPASISGGNLQQLLMRAGASVGMELVKWVVMTSVGTFVGVEGDKGIRATGNYILKTMKETSDEEMSKWPTGPGGCVMGTICV